MFLLNQQTNEKIILIARRHWIVILSGIITFVIFIFGGVIGLTFVRNLMSSHLELARYSNLIWLGFLFFFHLLLILIFKFLIDYYLDAWIITTERIIDIDQKGFFHREVSEFRISKVQDVTVEVNGILATFLDYGDVKVETAGESSTNFIFYQIPNPNKAKEIILQQLKKEATSL